MKKFKKFRAFGKKRNFKRRTRSYSRSNGTFIVPRGGIRL